MSYSRRLKVSSLSRLVLVLAATTAVTPFCAAQAAIQAAPSGRQWRIDAGHMTYVFGVNEHKALQSLYWGGHLAAGATLPPAHSLPERASFDPSPANTPNEYAGWGEGLATEPALKIDSPDGDRTLILQYAASQVNGDLLEITLKDATEPVTVHLFYQPFPQGILARWSRIENIGAKPLHIEQAASATWNLPQRSGYDLSWLTGQWGAEWQLHTAPIQAGAQVIESRRGSTSHQANPWFAISRPDETTETAGPVWFGELGWSGSWRMSVEDSGLDQVRVTAGYNPFDFSMILKAGESLETPRFYGGYTALGMGEASRILHRFQRAEILPGKPDPRPRPIIYNSWEATGFDVSEQGQITLADRAAKLGVERFVMDDGWFGQRKTDNAGLGDWYVNQTKFPHGLKPLIDHVQSLGMDFGIWVEPEMVNPDSDLYRKHPDWVLSFPNRQRTEARQQLVLNLAREDVRQYVFGFLDKLVTENDIAFLKWDYNRNWSEPGWDLQSPGAGHGNDPKEVYVRYVQNLYSVLAELRQKHPKLEIESCSGGGGRVDLGILRYTDEVWPSDNTNALDRVVMQNGFTHAYTPETMVAWVTDSPDYLNHTPVSLNYRFLVAMQGALGIGGNLSHWTPEMLDEATRLTAFYKKVRPTIQTGNLYRLSTASQDQPSQVEYVSQDNNQAVLFAYQPLQRYGIAYPVVPLRGLDANATYRITSSDPTAYTGEPEVSGSVLMGRGLTLNLTGSDAATALILERVPATK